MIAAPRARAAPADDLELGARLSLASGLIEARTKLPFIEVALGDLRIVLGASSRQRRLTGVTSLHGAIAEPCSEWSRSFWPVG
jgi:hypothetical protein